MPGINGLARVRRPKIGVLANTYEPDAGIWAGGHLHFVQVVKRWQGVDVVIFAPEIARRDLCAALPQCRFVALPSLPGKPPKAIDFLFFERSHRSFEWRQLRQCDALLATSHFLPDVVPAIASRKPVAVIIHHILTSASGNAARTGRLPALAESLSLLLVRVFANGVIAGSQRVSLELRSLGWKKVMTVTSNGVDHLHFSGALDIGREKRSGAVLVGRLHPTKNVDDAVRAWRLVVDKFPDERLTIIGAEAVPLYAASLRTLISDLGLADNVRLDGVVSDEEKIDALERAAMFVFPSGEEGWGIALAEAMRAGLPCVTYDLPIFDELFPRGRLVAPLKDHRALAAAMLALLEDESLRVRYAQEALDLAQSFTWTRAADAEAKLLASIL